MEDETKSTVTIIEEVCEDICEHYCEYRNTIDSYQKKYYRMAKCITISLTG